MAIEFPPNTNLDQHDSRGKGNTVLNKLMLKHNISTISKRLQNNTKCFTQHCEFVVFLKPLYRAVADVRDFKLQLELCSELFYSNSAINKLMPNVRVVS